MCKLILAEPKRGLFGIRKAAEDSRFLTIFFQSFTAAISRHLATFIAVICFFSTFGPIAAADSSSSEEDQLIAVLKSDASLQKKDAACVRLKIIGSDKCISALLPLLLDKGLSHSARYTLEPMSSPKAEQGLLEALGKTQGPIRLGIISSLGVRHDEKAVVPLTKLLKEADRATLEAACTALGQIGSAAALKPLLQAFHEREGSKERIPRELVDGVLRCANSLLASGKESIALSAFKELGRSTDIDTATRLAVYAGVIRASGKNGLNLEIAALGGSDPIERAAALKLAVELNLPGTTPALTALLPGLTPQAQSALIEALQRRNDPVAASGISALAASPSPEVRLAVIQALRDLGSDKQAALLAKMAASGNGEEQTAARVALVDLHRGPVTPELAQLLRSPDLVLAMEAARAIGQRGDRTAVPFLMDSIRRGTAQTRKPALQALAALATETELPPIVDFVAEAKNETERVEAAEALAAAYQHCQLIKGHAPAFPLLAKLRAADPRTRAALMRICSSLTDPEIRSELQKALHDPDAEVRQAAIRAICDTSDPKLLRDLVQLAKSAPEENFKTMAISACVRLTSPEENPHLSNNERLEPLESISSSSLTAAQKRQLLAGLGEIGDIKAFRLVEPMAKEPDVQAEARQAAVNIAGKLSGSAARETSSLLKTIVASSAGENVRTAAAQALNQIETSADWISSWQIAGPYLEAGKNHAALFDVPFPPESSGEGVAQVSWKTVESSEAGQKPWVVDLLKAIGGEQRVAYARTWIQSQTDQRVRLELGSDDGVKVWLNGQLVHAKNVARPLRPGSDKVDVDLKKGSNTLLLKITQNDQGWEFCARIVAPDGGHVEGWTVADAAKR
jgi:HEAT repeat protein